MGSKLNKVGWTCSTKSGTSLLSCIATALKRATNETNKDKADPERNAKHHSVKYYKHQPQMEERQDNSRYKQDCTCLFSIVPRCPL